jgi:hypothetical protein
MAHFLQQVVSMPGIEKDSPDFAKTSYIDGQWVRFYNNMPKKMGGYKLVDPGTTEIIRNLYGIEKNGTVDIYYGRPSSLIFSNYDEDGAHGDPYDRTPVGFIADPDNSWDFETITSQVSLGAYKTYIIATACPNSADINNGQERPIYAGDISEVTPLFEIVNTVGSMEVIKTDGGVVQIGEAYLFKFGSKGIHWCKRGVLDNWPEDNFQPTSTKVIQAYSIRSGGVPGGIFWTLNKVIRCIFDGSSSTADAFSFDVLEEDITILSPNCIIKSSSQFFWIGTRQFYRFSGMVEKLENNFATDYFFNNLNFSAREKVHGYLYSKYGEIHYHYPTGDSTECNALLVYNYEKGFWFTSNISRSASLIPNSQNFHPFLADSNTMAYLGGPPPPGEKPAQVYGLWMHETGLNRLQYETEIAIDSYFRTHMFTLNDLQGVDRNIHLAWVEPNFNQRNQMSLRVYKQQYGQEEPTVSTEYFFTPSTTKINLHEQSGLMSLEFRSNTVDGDYQMGKTMMAYEVGDPRVLE